MKSGFSARISYERLDSVDVNRKAVQRIVIANLYIAALIVLPYFLVHWLWIVVFFVLLSAGGVAVSLGTRSLTWFQLGWIGLYSSLILLAGIAVTVGASLIIALPVLVGSIVAVNVCAYMWAGE
ncbi:MAG: hypothetical protein ACE5QF_06405 [Thermoplasmata archaeon]